VRIFSRFAVYEVGANVLAQNLKNKMEGRKRKRCSDVEKITLTGREQQMNALRTFLSSHMKKRKPGLLFITGPPGSGKSATVEAVLAERVRKYL